MQRNLSRLTMAWPSPALFHPGDADMDVLAGVLAQGKSSRLWQRLVRDEKLCADVMTSSGTPCAHIPRCSRMASCCALRYSGREGVSSIW